MKHTYSVHGMTCNGCRAHVEETLSDVPGVKHAAVDLEKSEAIIEMESHIPLENFQKALKEAGGSYSIYPPGEAPPPSATGSHEGHNNSKKSGSQGSGVFYCPMHCEGDKTYDKPGDCPVCGMDLVEEQTLPATPSAGQWACPMQCEGDKTYDQPGDCPVCGMDLVPVQPELSAEDKTYNTLRKKFWVALADRKSTRLNSSHVAISYAVFCLKKK